MFLTNMILTPQVQLRFVWRQILDVNDDLEDLSWYLERIWVTLQAYSVDTDAGIPDVALADWKPEEKSEEGEEDGVRRGPNGRFIANNGGAGGGAPKRPKRKHEFFITG